MMPEMDGVVTVQEIRKLQGRFEELIIIALTANAVTGAREMFLSNRFNDFISKPIDANELQEIIQFYLPPEKVKTVLHNGSRQFKEEKLRKKAIKTFVKDNRETFVKIKTALSAGDIKTAHRIVHTLKSSAGYLNKAELQEAAASLEQSLQSKSPWHSPKQLEKIEKSLNDVISELEPMLSEPENKKSTVPPEKISKILSDLKPLLENSDFAASNFVEELQKISGLESLAERIDEYDFDGALQILKEKE
jgi:HPt (histidine-containing phosphotransfer) domain-containing protein